ncbi:MAG: bifunctional diguanylate cyclase/phosphodiesterase [Acidobacteriota bacterium]
MDAGWSLSVLPNGSVQGAAEPPGVAASARLPGEWERRARELRFAFQPIVNIHTGFCYGYEALLRGHESVGFRSIQELFDASHEAGVLGSLSDVLRRKAVGAFAGTGLAQTTRLFVNIDNRELEDPTCQPGAAADWLSGYGLSPESVCFELSERHQVGSFEERVKSLSRYRRKSFKLAIDDFGTGFSGLQLLYLAEPDFVKIDRFFISEIAADPRKRLFVASIVNIAHVLGVAVIAEGVETLREYQICREVGCDLIQGFFVQRPTTDISELLVTYAEIEAASRTERRKGASDERLILERMQVIEPLLESQEMSSVFERFRNDKGATFVPVINRLGEPLGIIGESTLRGFAYSSYGKDLLRNPRLSKMLPHFVATCPIVDINVQAERILDLFSVSGQTDGVLVVENGRYLGFLSASALLQIISDKNLLIARDQNPLTRLPGNTRIYEKFSEALRSGTTPWVVVYFDFDSFKPFNDIYGFRMGDRAIQMFAELLQKSFHRSDSFIGHIGGDDFVVIVSERAESEVVALVGNVARRFTEDVCALYTQHDRARGWVEGFDRAGKRQRFSLLSVSAGVLSVPPGPPRGPLDAIISGLAEMKRRAKHNREHVCVGALLEDGTVDFGSEPGG